MNSIKNKSAFTLIEILIVIALMVVMAGMAAMGFRKIDTQSLEPKDALQKAIRMGKYIARRDKKCMYLIFSKSKGGELPLLTGDNTSKTISSLYTNACFLIADKVKPANTQGNNTPNTDYKYEIKSMYDISEGEGGKTIDQVIIDKNWDKGGEFYIKQSGGTGINGNNDDGNVDSIKIFKDSIIQKFEFKYKFNGINKILAVENIFSAEVVEKTEQAKN
jgi:prepilin-type N-terminal cleavage/methylation domain-containing protein